MSITYDPTKYRGRMLIGATVDALFAIGNVGGLSHQGTVERTEATDYTSTEGGRWVDDEILDEVTLGGTLYDLDHLNIARALRASNTAVDAGTVNSEAHVATQGAQILTAYPSPSEVTITCTAGAWAAETEYDLGDMVLDTDVVYECTTAGESGSTEPTWDDEAGATTTDGTVTWTSRGTFAAVAGTDYEVRPAGLMISIGGGIPDGCPVNTAYSYGAHRRQEPMQGSTAYSVVVLELVNSINTTKKLRVTYHRVKGSVEQTLELISDGLTTIPLSLRCLRDTTKPAGQSGIFSVEVI
jgi:hypothetical protein